jgi:hypothetical protein
MTAEQTAQGGPAGLKEQVDAKQQYTVDTAIKRLKSQLATQAKAYNQLLGAFEEFKANSQFLADIEERYTEPDIISPVACSGTSESTLVAVGSDWHCFETVRPEQVNGLNKFNVEIADASVNRFHEGVCRWAQIHRAGTRVDTCVLAYLGDLMSGHLHDDQIEGNAGSPLEEALFVTAKVVAGIRMVAEQGGFKRLIVLSCDGNHSRITEKKRKANRVKHSLEWLIFHYIRDQFESNPGLVPEGVAVEFHIADGIHNYLTLDYAGGKTLRFSHGDEGIKYQGGIGGMSVTGNRTIDKWNVGRRADLDIFGHHHTSEHPRRYVANGSILGYAPLSLAGKYEFEVPSQTLLLFEKRRWETAYHRLYVRG